VSYLTGHWSFDPFLVLVAVVLLLHELGLRRIGRRSHAGRQAARRRQAVWFYGSLLLFTLAVVSPIDYWSSRYLWVHMVQHVLLMFLAPALLVSGAPWLPVAHGLPLSARQRIGRALQRNRSTAPLRWLGRTVSRPWVAVTLFNAVMVGWHVPAAFDLGERNQVVHVLVMHGSMVAVGTLFWLQLIPSRPFRMRLYPAGQVGALFLTNIVMWVLAMSMGLFARGSWYPVYAHLPGVTLSPIADQQIAAAILWVCGDFWASPALFVAIRRLRSEGGMDEAFERLVRRRPTLVPRSRVPAQRSQSSVP
jgi:putative membrane protein